MKISRISVAAAFCCWILLAGSEERESGGINWGPGPALAQVWTPPAPAVKPMEEVPGLRNTIGLNPGGWASPAAPLPVTRKPELFSGKELPNSVRQQIGLASHQEPVTEFSEPDPIPGSEGSKGSTRMDQGGPWTTGLPEPRELFLSPGGIQSTLRFSLLISALSLAPAIVLMTTCYIRVIVVLSLLKQAFAAQQLPPAQVVTALSLFLTFLIMAPVWQEVKTASIDPYAAEEISWEEAWNRGIAPVRNFMARQIEAAGNERSIEVFYQYAPGASSNSGQLAIPETIEEVPVNLLIPAFMISELKIAFLLGFQIFLPFLVLDLVVSSVAVSMGMFMLPPHLISFPLKLILFVLVDGWSLVVGMLLQSFG
jgi:flagellar biosynthetic protein FliP